ncbi:MAG TPA: leucine--tRNA ligase [Candidatus Paceibacterota bacterium]|nr:leucine--tRNA ligase [Candidatus Paceibacterota bacterium]
MKKYDHVAIERRWQKEWSKTELYKTPDSARGGSAFGGKASKKKNFYLLTEFPYPSGNLHVGHWYAFAVPDILARAMRMQGKNVLYPIGFDAFGLPAENAAIKNKLNPRKWTEENIAYMKKQITSMGASFDWSRLVTTCDPNYYKWTQWLFLRLFKKGLAYQKNTPVNWCPKDKTVLANEQVTNGTCERCDAEVVQKQMLQWNIKITDYADRLIDDLAPLNWPEQIKESQRNWIGRSEGAEIDFPLAIGADKKKYKYVLLHGFESRPDRPRFQFWKKELEKQGHEVIIPALPNPDNPSEEEQVKTALAAAEYDGNTVLFGHSLGAVVAMKVLEKSKNPIARLVLAGGFVDRNFKDRPRNFDKRFSWKFDGEKIRKNAGSITILHDTEDPAISEEQVKRLEAVLAVKAERVKGEAPHFKGEKEFPILRWLRPTVTAFTTRPDTLFGATYLVLAPEHKRVSLAIKHGGLLKNEDEVVRYIALSGKKTDMDRQTSKEKTGVKLEGVEAVNPATGEKIPVYIADYVLGHYGTGAIMAVPAHDERDFEFAKKLNLPIKQVILQTGKRTGELHSAFVGDGTLVNSGKFNGVTVVEGKAAITEMFGTKKTTYKLRDWIVSRQRYWGVPIPIIHCKKCGAVSVPDKDLPVELPEVEDYLPEGSGKSPLAKVKSFVQVKCPQCKGRAKRETDTLDTFVDSSWYFLRYTDPKNKKEFASKAKQKNWMPVDLYSGGAEHTTMHLLYSRFWHKALFDLGLVGDSEPYVRRMNRSLILGPDGQKMSKSRGNVVDPDDVVARFGADTVRLYLAFIGPYNEVSSYPWNPDGVVGIRRFLERVWKVGQSTVDSLQSTENANIEPLLHRTIKKVGEDISTLKFNTAISSLMILLNAIEKKRAIGIKQWKSFLKLLAPFAPHLAEELWREIGNKTSIRAEQWPLFDPALLKDENTTVVIQINGRTRGDVQVPSDSDKKIIEDAARAAVMERLKGKRILRIVVVPNRLVNFVTE